MAGEQSQDTAAEKAAEKGSEKGSEKGTEKASEKGTESSPLKGSEVLSARQDSALSYQSDQAERARKYNDGISTGTGSNRWLSNSVEIVDGLKKLVGKVTGPVPKGEIRADAKDITGVPDSRKDVGSESRVERDAMERPSKVEYSDGTSNRVEYDPDGNVTKVYLRDDSTIEREGDHWKITQEGKSFRWDGEIKVTHEGDIASIRPDGLTKVRHVDGSESVIEVAEATPKPEGKDTNGDVARAPEVGIEEAPAEKTGDKDLKPLKRPDGKVEIGTETWPKVSPTEDGERHEYPDGTGFYRVIGKDGNVVEEHHFGPSPVDVYTLRPNASGILEGTDDYGNKHYKWPDGHERTEYENGRTCDRYPQRNGFDEVYWGRRPGDIFIIKRTWDGAVEVKDDGAPPYKPLDDPAVTAAREKLDKLAREKLDPIEEGKFQADMARLEARTAEMQKAYEKEGMSPADAKKRACSEVAKTYSEVSKLLEAEDNSKVGLTEKQRLQIAQQIMSHAANPATIDQGAHPTCNVASVEMRAYTREPSEAAKLVVEVATTGEYKTRDGHTIEVDSESLQPHDEAKTHPPVDGQRGHASQIFQVTAVNVHYQRKEEHIRYAQWEPEKAGASNGELLLDYSTHPPKRFHAPELSDEQIADVGRQILGDNGHDWYVMHGEPGQRDGVFRVDSAEQLEERIKDAHERGQLPMVVKVHAGNEPFCDPGDPGGWHVVSVTDYDAGPPVRIAVDNQWGTWEDYDGKKQHKISVNDLYMSMRDSRDDGQIAELDREVQKLRSEGNPDYYKEADLLRLQFQDKQISKEQLQEKILEKAREIKEAKDAGTLNAAEYERNWKKVRDLTKELKPADRLESIQALKAQDFFNPEAQYEDELVSFFDDVYLADKQAKRRIETRQAEEKRTEEDDKADEEDKKTREESQEGMAALQKVIGRMMYLKQQNRVRQRIDERRKQLDEYLDS